MEESGEAGENTEQSHKHASAHSKLCTPRPFNIDYQDADEVKINRGTDFTLALHVPYLRLFPLPELA